MVRAWAAVVGAALLLAPAGAEARQRKVAHRTTPTSRYWTEAKHQKVHRERNVLSAVAKNAMAAVVSITTTQADGKSGDEQTGLGSGFIIHPDGYILTSAHVIDGAKDIKVSVYGRDGFTEEYEAKVIGQDKPTDFALLKIDAKRKLPVLPLGKGSDVDIADWVVVIGNPFGLGHSVSVGVVSFKGRTDVTPAGLDGFFDYIQTDAAINPGNSGGPMLDIHGNVVAIANAVNVSGQGIGFAIPIDVAKSVIPHLIRDGRVHRGWAGMSIQDLTPESAAQFGARTLHGVLVSEVVENSPAAKAGLRVGDVITSVDNVRTLRAHSLRWRVSNKGAGKKVKLRVERNGHPVIVSMTLAEQPEAGDPTDLAIEPALGGSGDAGASSEPDASAPAEPEVEATPLDLGASVADVTDESAKRAGLAGNFGALIASVEANSVLDTAGLNTGDVVVKLNKTEIGSRDDLIRALSEVPSGEWIRLFVRRNAQTHALTFRKP
ncbi:MAG: trypsin-like peptidase domain-containing protein [Myxococcaceae bacterium]|nr:trypsin-like peptidase domain-containing protein [Myxococcaceae bacterium]